MNLKFRKLNDNVKVINNTNVDLADNIFISNKIKKVDASQYLANAYLPVDNWARPTPNQLYQIQQVEEVDESEYSKYVTIFDIPNQLFESINTSDIPLLKTTKDVNRYLQEKTYISDKISLHLNSFLNESLFVNSKRFLGLHILPPKKSIGMQNKTEKYMGLHIDNSSGFNIDNFKRPNRVLLNFGKSPRYFYFVNKTTESIYYSIVQGKLPRNDDFLCTSYLQANLNRKVIILKINPGQGYIAPTEHLIHDGSSKDVEEKDVVMSILGFFNPNFKSSL